MISIVISAHHPRTLSRWVGRKGTTKVFKQGRKSPWLLSTLFQKCQVNSGFWSDWAQEKLCITVPNGRTASPQFVSYLIVSPTVVFLLSQFMELLSDSIRLSLSTLSCQGGRQWLDRTIHKCEVQLIQAMITAFTLCLLHSAFLYTKRHLPFNMP